MIHTPGPFYKSGLNLITGNRQTSGTSYTEEVIAEVRKEEDRTLLTAEPELLEAAQQALGLLYESYANDLHESQRASDLIATLEQAIAKAEGRGAS